MSITPMKRKRQPLPIPETACRFFGGKLPSTLNVQFTLRRSKQGVIVMLIAPSRFSWNLSSLEGRYPANFAEARQFVKQYGLRYGQTITEVPKPKQEKERYPEPKGPAQESWLESDNPKEFAEAMLVCEHAGGHCGQDGFCHYGNCFPAQTYAQRHPTKEPTQ